jgi:regulator of sigma E protease
MSVANIVHALLVVFGVGLVIFVHELGHFLAARWAGAKVEVFSIGIGPKLWGWRRGDTLFQVAALPLGGFVKLMGEYPEAGRTARPGELGAMSVFHRVVYYSGGVVMNVLFALVVMPLVLLVGLPGVEPVLGEPLKGTPAWHARLEPGSRVERVNGHDPLDFMGLAMEIAVAGKRDVDLVLRRPDGTLTDVTVTPEYEKASGTYKIGVTSAIDPDTRLVVQKGSPAEAAGLKSDERVLSIVGQPEFLPPLTQLERALERGAPVTLRVAAPGAEPREVTVTPTEKLVRGRKLFGVMPMQNRIADVRTGAESVAERIGLAPEDRVVSVAGRPVLWSSDFLTGLVAAEGPFEIVVQRDGADVVLAAPALTVAEKRALDLDVLLDTDLESSAITLQPGRAAARGGVQDGDRVVSVDGRTTSTWKEVFDPIQAAAEDDRAVRLEIWRDVASADGGVEQVTLAFELQATSALDVQYGLGLATLMGVQRASGFGEALRAGALSSWRLLANTWRTLQKMLFTDEVSTKNLGGIITISVLSFQSASEGLPHLFFILAFISLNLAIINLLPIPILDGGHLMFLLVEWIKGGPVSERTLGYSQAVGLVLLLSLMIYVTYQDVVRFIFKG